MDDETVGILCLIVFVWLPLGLLVACALVAAYLRIMGRACRRNAEIPAWPG